MEEIQRTVNLKVEDQMTTLHELGLKLWNLVIAKKLGKVVSRTAAAQGIDITLLQLLPFFTLGFCQKPKWYLQFMFVRFFGLLFFLLG